MGPFDKTDLRILNALQQNGRLSNVELAERVALSPSPCLRRLKQLEDDGVIDRYAALLSPTRIGLGLQAFIRVTLAKNREIRSAFELAVRDWDEVLNCLALTGESDYILHAFSSIWKAFPILFWKRCWRARGCWMRNPALCSKKSSTPLLCR